MPNKYAAHGCSTGYDTNDDHKITYFHFPQRRKDLLERWIKFANRRNWEPSTNSSLCKKHFQEQYMHSQVEIEFCSHTIHSKIARKRPSLPNIIPPSKTSESTQH